MATEAVERLVQVLLQIKPSDYKSEAKTVTPQHSSYLSLWQLISMKVFHTYSLQYTCPTIIKIALVAVERAIHEMLLIKPSITNQKQHLLHHRSRVH